MPGRKTQSENNPFSYSDTNKRYYTYDYYLRKAYGGKCVKIPLDAGFSCPNRENGGTGCIYCSSRGSGDFAESAALSISEQYRTTVRPMFEQYIRNYINLADVIVARGGKNARIVEILNGYVAGELHKRQSLSE